MAPDSNTTKSSLSRSTMVGIRPLGLSWRYSGCFCSSRARLSACTSYGSCISSKAMEIVWPLGVAAVYRSIMGSYSNLGAGATANVVVPALQMGLLLRLHPDFVHLVEV